MHSCHEQDSLGYLSGTRKRNAGQGWAETTPMLNVQHLDWQEKVPNG